MRNVVNGLISFQPNIRTSEDGYTWGKESENSNILQTLPLFLQERYHSKILAERWMSSDDQKFASLASTSNGFTSFRTLLEEYGDLILGKEHMKRHGPYLGTVMKLLDTNAALDKGGLSVQIHPKPGHPHRPSKPEMWKGVGSVYYGWEKDLTPQLLVEAVQTRTLEQYMNLVTLTEEDLLLVPGGTVHAIRANSYLREWSKAPGRDEIKKGNIQMATVALYDGINGKTPRPGKEDIDGSFEVMRHAESFEKVNPKDFQSNTITIVRAGCEERTLFRTEEVCVKEYLLRSTMTLSLEQRGLPLYAERGSLEVFHEGKSLGIIAAGEEVFIPAHLKQVELNTTKGATFYTWYRPF